mgnify:CR=1 FL=1
MNPMITNAEKRSFVDWFLKNHELQKKECAWLLTYLMSEDKLLEKVRFVDDITNVHRSIVISAKGIKGLPFQFKKGKIISSDVQKAFHDLRLNPDEDIFIKLIFTKSEQCPEYAAVCESIFSAQDRVRTNTLYSLLADMVLDEALEKFEIKQLYAKIDRSLEKRDRETFLRLSQRLKQLRDDES